MKQERKLVLELCKFLNPNYEKLRTLTKESLNWPWVLEQLHLHRVGAIAYQTLLKAQLLEKIPQNVSLALKEIHSYSSSRGESMLNVVKELQGALKNTTFPYAFLKGSFLNGYYPKGLRTSNDVDLLVSQKDLSEIEKLLLENGFSQGYLKEGVFFPASRAQILSARMNRGETVPFVKYVGLPQMDYLEVDLNFSLDFKAKQETGIVEQFLENAQNRSALNGFELHTLEEHDFFIHLCVHLYKEATTYSWVERGNDLSLYKFTDLFLLFYLWLSPENAYFELAKRICDYGLEKECFFALSYFSKIFEISDSRFSDFLKEISPESKNTLNLIYSPVDKKTYCHNRTPIDWLFTERKLEELHEIKFETT